MTNTSEKIIIGIGLLSILLGLVLTYSKRKTKRELRKRVLAENNPDYSETAKNIKNSILKSKDLYKSLIIQVHPDKFLDAYKEIASELSARITKSKKNYDELMVLKIEVEEFINNIK